MITNGVAYLYTVYSIYNKEDVWNRTLTYSMKIKKGDTIIYNYEAHRVLEVKNGNGEFMPPTIYVEPTEVDVPVSI